LRTEEVLLGMSFLRYIEFSQRGDTLILRQYPG
jgi:aspartyl protease family protein